MSGFISKLLAIPDVALCLVRKWWRPIICLGIGGSLMVNGVVLPLLTLTYPHLSELAAVIAAAAPFAVVRAVEKRMGVDAKA